MGFDDYRINIQLECAGKVLEVNRAYDLTGCEASDYSPNLQANAQLDGAILNGNNIEPREIGIAAVCESKTRDFLVRFFNPKEDIKVKIKMYENMRWIMGRVSEFQFVKNRVGNRNAFEVAITCADPFFRDMDSFGKNIANIVKQFAFPFISPVAAAKDKGGTYHWIKGHLAGYRQFNTRLNLDNTGDIDAGAVFRIEAQGEVVNPIIKHESGAFVRVKRTLAKGDVLTINTERGEKRIELNGANSFQYIDRDSEMFQLNVGSNMIEYDADVGYTNMAVYVYYTPRYLGI